MTNTFVTELDRIKEHILEQSLELERISQEVEEGYFGGSGHARELHDIAELLKELTK